MVYVSTPSTLKDPEAAIVIAPDVFGIKLINNKLVADKFAEATGCLVVLVEYFHGNGMDPYIIEVLSRKNAELSWWGWFGKYTSMFTFIAFTGLPWFLTHGHGKTVPHLVNVLKYLRSEKKIKRIAAVGYCYGGGVLSITGSGEHADLADSYCIVHPGGWKMDHVSNFKKPFMWIFTERDNSCTEPQRLEVEKIMKSKEVKTKTKYYAGVDHGFAIRGDPKDKIMVEARADCFHECVTWFRESLGLQK